MTTLEERLHMEDGYHFPNAAAPLIRSSDAKGLADPFSWFLSRRLGLRSALSHSNALSRGSWFHAAFQCWRGVHDDNDTLSRLETVLEERMGELSEACDLVGWDGDRRTAVIQREEADMRTAWAWFQASRKVPVPQLHGKGNVRLPWTEWLVQDQFTWLDVEPSIRVSNMVAQPDLLLWHKGQRSVWIVDLKTCSGSPLKRLDGCRGEFQTLHYMHVLRGALRRPSIREAWNLPADARLGGFIHVAVSKPSIEICGEDRDYDLDTSPLKSGPNKGQPRNERRFRGEPKLSNYVNRVSEWFLSEGRYAHLAGERSQDPPVNASIVSSAALDDPWLSAVHMSRLRAVEQMHGRRPSPLHYPAVGDVEAPWSSDPLFPLRHIEPSKWLRWCTGSGMVVFDRDPPYDPLNHPDAEIVRQPPAGGA